MTVHNHGAEEGPGLACREAIIDGELVGACMPCTCGHGRHCHIQGRGVCITVTISGPANPAIAPIGPPDLHIGRTVRYCPCSAYAKPKTEQPGTGEQVQNSELQSEETTT